MRKKQQIVLAGDIGGTSARLACYQGNRQRQELLAEQWFPCRQYGSLAEIIHAFFAQHDIVVDRACFGVAGNVQQNEVHTPNLPWTICGNAVANALKLPAVQLINDLVANLLGIATLHPTDLLTLNQGRPTANGIIGVISPGTGLGEAIAYWNDDRYQPLPSEAGHADFAPRNELEAELLLALHREHGRISYERVISGPGLQAIYRFLRNKLQIAEQPSVVAALEDGTQPAAIAQMALAHSCTLCVQSLDMFISCLGAEAGNLALRSLTRGGIYLGGGIAPKIIEKLKEPTFLLAFMDKGRLRPLLESIPVQIILNEHTALQGAARWAFLHK